MLCSYWRVWLRFQPEFQSTKNTRGVVHKAGDQMFSQSSLAHGSHAPLCVRTSLLAFTWLWLYRSSLLASLKSLYFCTVEMRSRNSQRSYSEPNLLPAYAWTHCCRLSQTASHRRLNIAEMLKQNCAAFNQDTVWVSFIQFGL